MLSAFAFIMKWLKFQWPIKRLTSEDKNCKLVVRIGGGRLAQKIKR